MDKNEYNIRDNIRSIVDDNNRNIDIILCDTDSNFPVNSDLIFVFKKELKELDTATKMRERALAFDKIEKLMKIDLETLEPEQSQKYELELEKNLNLTNKIPATLILDDLSSMNIHELTRHLSIAKNLTQVVIPNLQVTDLKNLKYLNPEIIESELDIFSEKINWDLVYDDIYNTNYSVVVFIDVNNNPGSVPIFDVSAVVNFPDNTHYFIIASGDGKFSNSAIKAAKMSKLDPISVSYQVCDNSPLIEVAANAREKYNAARESEVYSGFNRQEMKLPGTPFLSSSLVCSLVHEIGL